MSRRRPSLSDYDTSSLDDYAPMQSDSWNKGRGRWSSKIQEHLPLFGGINDQCGTCHQPLDRCEWQAGGTVGPHPR